jgi:hypothetical protein
MIEINILIPDELQETAEFNCGNNVEKYFSDMILSMLYRFKEQNEKSFLDTIPREELKNIVKIVKEGKGE